jgi:hypothetical protein
MRDVLRLLQKEPDTMAKNRSTSTGRQSKQAESSHVLLHRQAGGAAVPWNGSRQEGTVSTQYRKRKPNRKKKPNKTKARVWI